MRIRPDELRFANRGINLQSRDTSVHFKPHVPKLPAVVTDFPFPTDTVKRFLEQRIESLTGQRIDPDQYYLHEFPESQTTVSADTATGWRHSGTPKSSMTLTQAAMNDFFSAEKYGTAGKAQAVAHFMSSNVSFFSIFESENASDFFSRVGRFVLDRTGPGYIYSKIHEDVPHAKETFRDLDAVFGIYKEGSGKGAYNAGNELRLKPSEFLNIVREGDLQNKVTGALTRFWETHGAQWRGMAKAEFIKQAREARALNQDNPGQGLNPEAFARVMRSAAGKVALSGTVTPSQLEALAPPAAPDKVLRLDINGYVSNDILRFVAPNGGEVLYVPGGTPAFHTFENAQALNRWVVEQGQDPQKAQALEQHFALRDRQQGVFGALSVNGVDSALKKLGSGQMVASDNHINTRNLPVAQDVFSMMQAQTRQRIEQDVDTEMKSNQEVHKDNVLGLLQAGNAVFSIPLALLGPIGMTVGALSLSTQVALEVDKGVEGDTTAERQAGMRSAAMDMATMAFFHAVGKATSQTAEAPPTQSPEPGTGNSGLAPKPFFNYRRVNGQVGVVMSPTRSPRLPEPQEGRLNPSWDPEMEIYLFPGTKRPQVQPRYEVEQSPQAKRPRVDESEEEVEQSPSSVASDASSSADYEPYDDAELLKTNRYQTEITPPAGGYFNSRGMIERTDLTKLYRVEKIERVDRREKPDEAGFRSSNFFSGPEKMMDGDVVVASRSKEAAMKFGETEFGGDYYLYEIESDGIRAVSFNENIEANPQFVEDRQCVAPGTIEHLRNENRLGEFAENSYQFDEVHLDNNALRPERITRIPHD